MKTKWQQENEIGNEIQWEDLPAAAHTNLAESYAEKQLSQRVRSVNGRIEEFPKEPVDFRGKRNSGNVDETPAPGWGEEEVLLASANREFQIFYSRLLRAYGLRIATASNGLECLERMRRWVPKLMILEFELPWGGGDGILQILRDDPRLFRIPVVLFSAVATQTDLLKYLRPPVVNVMVQPTRLSDLFDCVADLEAFGLLSACKTQTTFQPKRAIREDYAFSRDLPTT